MSSVPGRGTKNLCVIHCGQKKQKQKQKLNLKRRQKPVNLKLMCILDEWLCFTKYQIN